MTVIVDVVETFKFETVLPKEIKTINRIPATANLLAVLYPFTREKINDCFNANNRLFLLNPMNTYRLLEDMCQQTNPPPVTDKRSSSISKS